MTRLRPDPAEFRIGSGYAPSVYPARMPKLGAPLGVAIETHLESQLINPLPLRSDDSDGFVWGGPRGIARADRVRNWDADPA